MQTLAIMSCPCLSLTLVEIILSIQIGSHNPNSHKPIQISSHHPTVLSVLSRYHCPVIHHNQPCLQVLWQYYQWMMEGYLWWGTTQSMVNVMKDPSCNKTSSIHCWSSKGLLWMFIMVRPRSVATQVTSPLSLWREDSFITLDLNEIFSVLTQNFAFLPRKLMVSHSQGFRASSLPSPFLYLTLEGFADCVNYLVMAQILHY